MGRYNFAALRHRRLALQKLDSRRIDHTPPWYNALTTVPVSQILVRQQPTPHPLLKTRTRQLPSPERDISSVDGLLSAAERSSSTDNFSTAKAPPKTEQYTFIEANPRPRKSKKKSRGKAKLFKPVPINYEEDSIRTLFFSDHPWELARPRMVLEQTGDDANNNNHDWSKGVCQEGKALSGECCVQRTLWLLQNTPDITLEAAYDKARKEFYNARLKEDIQRRIAPEEASHYGATFGPSIFQKSMRHEDKAFEEWRVWATQEQEMRLQARTGIAAPPLRTPSSDEDESRSGGRPKHTRGVRGMVDDYGDDDDVLIDDDFVDGSEASTAKGPTPKA